MYRARRLKAWRIVAGVSLATLATGGVVAGGAQAGTTQSTSQATCPWMNTHKSASQRAQLLLNASSLAQEERWLVEQPANEPTVTSFTSFATGITVTYPQQLPCTPDVTYTDGPDGIRGINGVTAFPSQIALASTWDTKLSYSKGKAQAQEAFQEDKNGVLGPMVLSGRTPLDGRTPEALGEDTLLGGDMAASMINGLQSNRTQPVMADLKHYLANEQEFDRNNMSANIDERTLQEVYNLPFGIALSKSAPASVMCAYPRVNGTYSCENPLLTTALRGQFHFKGYTVSDFFAIHSTAPSLKAGLDQELNAPIYYTPDLLQQALDAHLITRHDIDQAAFHVVRAYIAAGLFDHPLPATPAANASTDAHKALSRHEAEEASVLLKNSHGALPLNPKPGQSIAMIGASASATATGGINAQSVCSQTGFGGSNTMNCEDVVAPLDSITQRAAQNGASVTFNDGTDTAAAAQAAASAQTAVVFAYQRTGEGQDLTNLNLQGNGDALISAVAAANPHTIVVLETGSAVVMPWLNQVSGVMDAWYPGDQQGPAIASLLFGDVNFSGKLPMTFPQSVADLPTQTTDQYPGEVDANGVDQVNFSEGLAVGYKWYQAHNIKPLFPFGYGLSYTRYRYSNLRVHSTGHKVCVDFDVTNEGRVAGSEIAQVYLTYPNSAGEPGSRLAAFRRVTVRPGRSQHIRLTIDGTSSDHPFSIWNTARSRWSLAPGLFRIGVGGSSSSIALKGAAFIH